MSNVGYDLDTSGGLMPLIRALIKPPDEEPVAPKSKKPQHPYYKRPGKGHNHDSCDACSEGGDLICCDRCPASFHLGCYDPPLDENDIPAGLWLCKECRASDAEMPASTKSSRAQSPADNKSDTEKKTRSLRNSSTSSKAKSKEDETEVKEELEGEKELSPMEILVKAAKIMNPRQFELPREMRVPCLFPGTEKEGGASLVTVDGSGCVPLPAASCFVCGGSCKPAPLLQCDYCPLLFHQDCLDPPLTALPTGRWMCPNHVEQYIDWKLVNSISATERVALWDKFSGPVDQHAIKLDFIRRARTAAPAFRMKIPVRGRQCVDVPAMVRHHYRRPPPLLPSRREYLRCTNVLRNLKARGAYSSSSEGSGDESKHGICMNLQCPEYSGGKCPRLGDDSPLRGATHEDAADDLDAIDANKQEKQTDDDSLSDLSDSDFEYLTAAVKRRKLSVSSERSPKKRPERLELRDEGDAEALLAAVDNQLKKLDERLVKLLAWQRLQQVLVGEQSWGAWRACGVSARAAHSVARALGGGRLARLGLGPPALPSQLLTRADRERIARAVWGAPPARPRPRPRAPPARPALPDAAVRATLCAVPPPARNGALATLGRPIPMRLSSLSVGADSGCDVRLDPMLCRYVSRNHAIIFMDEVTRHFELINYSEWGSQVNGVLYTCDVTRPLPEPPERPFRTNINAPQPHRINGDLTKPIKNESPCRCPPSPVSGAWEGSALVPHGALLQFGCLMYVFSITDSQAFPYDTPIDNPAL